jgi:hypothetical protein
MHDDLDTLQYEARQNLQVQEHAGTHAQETLSAGARPAMACITCDTAVLKGLGCIGSRACLTLSFFLCLLGEPGLRA